MHCLLIGGGVIGLSLARVLAGEGVQVTVLDRGPLGREASWAGAGILPPSSNLPGAHPFERLRTLANQLHPQWAAELQEETGLDNGFRRSGGIYLARSVGEAASLKGLQGVFADEHIEVESLTPDAAAQLEPVLRPLVDAGQLRAAFLLPGETQIRNPVHLQALIASCQLRGVELRPHVEALNFDIYGDRIQAVETSAGRMEVDLVCLTAGAWSQQLLQQLGARTSILPIRGQMILYRLPQRAFTHVLNEGPRYLTPRDDGRVLAGSTEEEAGFDKSNTAEGVADLRAFAETIVPALREAVIEKTWAGLRPAVFDGFPYMGPIPRLTNAFASAGHYRSGLHLSPAVSMELASLILGRPTQVELSTFQVARG
ncbi:glycine oxidase ThiO [Lignipirellula cremea]|uniref:Glycine oxidase n=1 Tax=Lignipirellula cremea TaxID=2528010 RepID=A0A518DY54_9BACT|nr:glycine oxidase ThiO [Lignipirellula cremea]QDU96776.1 Glycine oxidase [Lignipirellula cremea]